MIEGDALLVHPVRGHLYLGLQALRGHPLGRFVRELEGSERLTPAEFDRLHDQRLRDILAYARERVPLYRTEPWQTALRDRGDAIDAWPVLERDVVQAHADELRALPRGRRDVELRSSGSTGRPVAIALTREAETWTWAHRYRMMMWHGVAIGAPSLRLSHDRHGLRDRLLGHKHLPTLATTEALAEAGRYLRRARPPLVMGPPSALFRLARYLRESGATEPLVRIARVGGEQLFPFQRAEIEAVLASRVVDAYGCTEIGAIAGECPAGALHVYGEHVHLEIVRGAVPAPAGELGDVVLTSLANPAMPLVRYRVGDRGRLSPDRCTCGMPHPVLLELRARQADTILSADGGRHHASVLVERLGEFFADPVATGARQVQLEQVDPVNWQVWIEAPAMRRSADAGDGARSAMEARLAVILRGALGSECRLEARLVDRLEATRGKFRYYR